MKRRKLPIGIQSFAKMREGGYYYVDKTPFIDRMVMGGSYFFLSRPRRFGKSLFVDTLAEAFSGNRDLFRGLYLESHWDWERIYPVIRIGFGGAVTKTPEQLCVTIDEILSMNQERLGITCRMTSPSGRLGEVIRRAAEHFGERAVVLVDEYDKPILDNLTEPERAAEMRERLKDFYAPIKKKDGSIQLAFVTGVSKFSKVSIFSGMNNLIDMTLDARYASICGYTETDLDRVFAPELEFLDRDEIRKWYNGYSWLGEGVYNPFDILLLFDTREFRSWWFETGTPTFLVDWLKRRCFHTPKLERLFASEDLFSAFDIERIQPEALLWQTGYLTIRERLQTPSGPVYYLGPPNHEVRTALNRALQHGWLPDASTAMEEALSIYDWLATNDQIKLLGHFERLFSNIPNDWYRNNPIAGYEGYFASVFYSHLAALGLDLIGEDVSNQGRCDLAIRQGNRVFLFEFKVIDGEAPTGEALAQLRNRDYAAKYRDDRTEIVEIGIEFSRGKRQIVGWQTAVADRWS